MRILSHAYMESHMHEHYQLSNHCHSAIYDDQLVSCLLYTDAAYRYYRSRCEENSASRRGLSATNQKKKRRHERIARVS